MKTLKNFKKFAINNKQASIISGGSIPLDGGGNDGGGSGGGSGSNGTTALYCCGGEPGGVCDTALNVAITLCRINGLQPPTRVR
ncbi:hypothetical protein [Bernardetia sp.]|uniref:hypothetical protein n=1 Tax=Bernardetia sp. TaxID=1937974 RepID=UPI0025BF6919|nr:hypothetical protein [Bernardetia sp.]